MKKRQFKKEIKKIGSINSYYYSSKYFKLRPRHRKNFISFLIKKNRDEIMKRMREFSIPLKFGFKIHDQNYAMIQTASV